MEEEEETVKPQEQEGDVEDLPELPSGLTGTCHFILFNF